MEKGQGFCDRNPLVDGAIHLAIKFYESKQAKSFYAEADVVWEPTGKKSHNENDCSLQGLAFLMAFGVWQFWNDNAITNENDKSRQEKTNHNVEKTESDCPGIAVLLWVETITHEESAFIPYTGKH